jgi:purine nucleoside permease
MRGRWLALLLACCAFACAPAVRAQASDAPPAAARALKVLIISMFEPEAAPWIEPLQLKEQIRLPGLLPALPAVRCNADDVCLLAAGMGHANVAASTMAVVLSRQFDLRKTYFLVAGIAGVDPRRGTTGSAAWARYLVDFGIAHEIDAREMPKEWHAGYFGIFTRKPGDKPKLDYFTEVFQLDEALLQKALALSRDVQLDDSAAAMKYRKRYPYAPANRPPRVIQCDTAAGDTWWHGHVLGQVARDWTKTLTDGKGVYCTTQQEDNATMAVIVRAEAAGLADSKRVAVLRTGANFDRPAPGQSAYASIHADSGGFALSTANLVRAGKPLVDDIVRRWEKWQDGVPKD